MTRVTLTALLSAASVLCLPAVAGSVSDPYFASAGSWQQKSLDQWAARAVLAEEPVPLAGSQSVLIALIDTGVDYTHDDFPRGSLWRNEAESVNGRDDDGNGYVDDVIGWDFVGDTNNPMDQSGHGTHLAGIIAACTDNGVGIAGVAPGVRLLPLKAASFAGSARADAVAAAIRYAVAASVDIINLSLARDAATAIEAEAIDEAVRAGVLVIASAGNDARRAAPSGYAGLPGVLAVAASDSSGERAGFSAANVEVDLIAPGVDVLSLRATGTDFINLTGRTNYEAGSAVVGEGYYRASGTSFATAMVTGVAARVAAARSELDGAGLSAVLMASARDVAADGIDQHSGHGAVSLADALRAAPEDFVDLRLTGTGLAEVDGEIVLELLGRAPEDIDAWIELGQVDEGGNASKMRRLADPVSAGPVLARIPLSDLAASNNAERWQFRLLAPSAAGTPHSSTLQVLLPRLQP
ncbi:MAG: S8 family serine peptidase [Pseudomonadaceae bacterium]|nr:S8 family serine peptidase [Pseudomonadaceae bacterium]